MNLQQLQQIVIDALEDVKGQDIRIFDTTGMTDLFDRVVIASGTSNRQTVALADRVRTNVKQAGGDVIAVEGEDTGEWVLVDCGDVVVHIMQPAIRQYYDLEELWGRKPVTLPAPAQRASAARSASPVADEAEAEATPAKRAPRRRATTASVDGAAPTEAGAEAPKRPRTRKAATPAVETTSVDAPAVDGAGAAPVAPKRRRVASKTADVSALPDADATGLAPAAPKPRRARAKAAGTDVERPSPDGTDVERGA